MSRHADYCIYVNNGKEDDSFTFGFRLINAGWFCGYCLQHESSSRMGPVDDTFPQKKHYCASRKYNVDILGREYPQKWNDPMLRE